MLKFDENHLIRKLTGLSERSRGAFALLAAFRILPCYRRFSLETGLGDPDQLEAVAESVWEALLIGADGNQLEAVSLAAEELVPSEEESWDAEYQPFAEDAAASVAYAAKCLASGSVQEAAWAGQRVYEAIDYFVRNSPALPASQRDREGQILSHQLVQNELERQEQDLRDLTEREIAGSPAGDLEALRARSETAAASFFQER